MKTPKAQTATRPAQTGRLRPAPGTGRVPEWRRLCVYSYDPGRSTTLNTAEVNRLILKVPWESNLQPGPVGDRVEVVDYDPASGGFYEPVDLNDPNLLARDGLEPSEGTPQFHQQMVYAVAMTTIQAFERALGRLALWNPFQWVTEPAKPANGRTRKIWRFQQTREHGFVEKFVPRLRLYPHALRDANAYYSREKKAILFGYFPARPADLSAQLPGSMVFTCLSHDVIVHETTHALLDGLHPFYSEQTSVDSIAFHEGFADLVALLLHFTHPEALRHELARSRGALACDNLLLSLAMQFGQSIGRRGALRQVLGDCDNQGVWQPARPDPARLAELTEPHERGSVLVSAFFDAFVLLHRQSTADLMRIATRGTGVLPEGALHPDLVNRLAEAAGKLARHLLRMVIRALDYCPPVDMTLGDFLRAVITADSDLVPEDTLGYRVALIEAFRRWGVYPNNVRTLSEESLRWRSARLPASLIVVLSEALKGIAGWDLVTSRKKAFDQNHQNRRQLEDDLLAWLEQADPQTRKHVGNQLGLCLEDNPPLPGLDCENLDGRRRPRVRILSARPAWRIRPNGQPVTEMVIEILQRRSGYLDPNAKHPDSASHSNLDFWFRGGCTLILDPRAREVRYAVTRDIASKTRYERQRTYHAGENNPITYAAPLEATAADPFALSSAF